MRIPLRSLSVEILREFRYVALSVEILGEFNLRSLWRDARNGGLLGLYNHGVLIFDRFCGAACGSFFSPSTDAP